MQLEKVKVFGTFGCYMGNDRTWREVFGVAIVD